METENKEVPSQDVQQEEKARSLKREQKPQPPSRRIDHYHRWLHLIGQLVNILQRLMFLGLGAWTLIHTGNLFDALVVVAMGFINARWAKDILANFLKSRSSNE